MKCVRHCCQEQPGSTAAIAAVRPLWSSEMTRLTPESPPSRKIAQELGLGGSIFAREGIKFQDLPVTIG